ncbi:MAG: hypothetical protein QW514_00850 [Thermoprotei archaeon]
MVSERVIGGLILAVFLVILVAFTVVLWYPPIAQAYSILALKIVDWVIVVGVSAIAIWLGWVMVSTKPIVPEETPEPAQGTVDTGATSSGGTTTANTASGDAKKAQTTQDTTVHQNKKQ